MREDNDHPSSSSSSMDASREGERLVFGFDCDCGVAAEDTLLVPFQPSIHQPHADYFEYNPNDDSGMSLFPSSVTASLPKTDADSTEIASLLDGDQLQACLEGNNMSSETEVLSTFTADVASHHHTTPSYNMDMAYDSSSLDMDDCVYGSNMGFDEDYIIPSHPKRLTIPTDATFLDPVHNFLRSVCIEVFVSDSVGCSTGRVGLRCVYCKHVPKRERANQAVSYPSKTTSIYESMRNFQRSHFEACEHIPDDIKRQYRDLVSSTHRKISLQYVKVYVAEAACQLGMVQTPSGLIFGAPPNANGKPSEKLITIMKVAENPHEYKHLHDDIFPKVDDRLKKSKFSHIASKKTLNVINLCRKKDAAFVKPSDFPTISDFCFVLYHQFAPCRPPITALKRRKTRPKKWDTLSGICCKYCAEAPEGHQRHNKGMYFPLDLGSLDDSSSSFSHNAANHVMTCEYVPLEIREALEELQSLAAKHGITTTRGTKKKFMKKLWERLSNYYPAP